MYDTLLKPVRKFDFALSGGASPESATEKWKECVSYDFESAKDNKSFKIESDSSGSKYV